MRRAPFFVPLFALGLAGCGDDATDASPANDAGSDGGVDVATDAGPCDPFGTWSVTTLDAGADATERVSVARGDGGALAVAFVDRAPPTSSCGLPDGGPAATSSASGTFDAATCALVLEYHATYCYSGEDQCENAKLTLRVTNDAASGVASIASGACMDLQSVDRDVTATRVP